MIPERMREEIEDGLASLPPHLQPGLARYIFEHVRPGQFLQAFLRNDLAEALRRGDPIALRHLLQIMWFFDNVAPETCWGSAERVEAWLASGAEGQQS